MDFLTLNTMSNKIPDNFTPLIYWKHFYPSKDEIAEVITKIVDSGIPDVIQRINRKLCVNEKIVYKYLEEEKFKKLKKEFKSKLFNPAQEKFPIHQ